MPPKRRRSRIVISTDSDDDANNKAVNNQNQQHQQLQPDKPEVSSDSDDPVSRKACKLAINMRKSQEPQHKGSPTIVSVENPLTYAMKNGKFPKPTIILLEHRQEHQMLTDPGYLWNALPPRYSQYLDMEAAHEGSTTSGSTGSSEGSLSDADFIVKDDPHENVTEEELQELQRLFPKTFKHKVSQGPHLH
jgi:hypothetical protein